MSNELLIVDNKLLPKCYEKVVLAKKMLQEGKYDSISKVCAALDISRSTFYKYQNKVFAYENKNEAKKMVVSLVLLHKKGALSKVCDKLAKYNISILTVFQNIPIDNLATVMFSLDITNINVSIDRFKKEMISLNDIKDFKVMSFEQ